VMRWLGALAGPDGERALTGSQLQQLYLLWAELLERRDHTEDAIAACNEALRHAETAEAQGKVLRRMGKLLEEQDQERALACYHLALERLAWNDAEVPALLRDRSLLLLHRQELEDAERDLATALEWFGSDGAGADGDEGGASRVLALQADLHEAFSTLRRAQGDSSGAVASLQTALALRRRSGDLMRLARSCNNLGILCHVMGEYGKAIAAYRESFPIFDGLGHHELAATALLNIGTAHHFAGQLAEAEQEYRRCLAMADRLGLALTEVRAHANLAEVLADQGRDEQALGHWQLAHDLGRSAGYAEEVAYLRELLARYPLLEQQAQWQLQAIAPDEQEETGWVDAPALDGEVLAGNGAEPVGRGEQQSGALRPVIHSDGQWGALDADEAAAMMMAQAAGRVTATALMRVAGVSKATATRKLAHLASLGLLARHGQGRGTYYVERGAAAGERDREALQACLDGLLERFVASHGVEGFSVGALFLPTRPEGVEGWEPRAQAGRFDVAVRFGQLPELRAFLELEQLLSVELGQSVRLLLMESAL